MVRHWVRNILVGRPNGTRAQIRKTTGWFTWLDRDQAPSSDQIRGAPGPGETPVAPMTPAASEPEIEGGWTEVLQVHELAEGATAEVFVGGQPVVVANVGGAYFAVDATCLHAGGPLADGELEGSLIVCPWHGWAYDVRTGEASIGGQSELGCYPVRVEGTAILVEV